MGQKQLLGQETLQCNVFFPLKYISNLQISYIFEIIVILFA